MKEFEVTIKETVFGVMTIKAKSADEAEDKAYELWSEGIFTCDSDADMEVVNTEKL